MERIWARILLDPSFDKSLRSDPGLYPDVINLILKFYDEMRNTELNLKSSIRLIWLPLHQLRMRILNNKFRKLITCVKLAFLYKFPRCPDPFDLDVFPLPSLIRNYTLAELR